MQKTIIMSSFNGLAALCVRFLLTCLLYSGHVKRQYVNVTAYNTIKKSTL